MHALRGLTAITPFLLILAIVTGCGSDDSSAPLTLGEVPDGTPLASLYFEDVRYTYNAHHVVVGDSTTFAIDGFNVEVAKLEVVGTTTLGPGSIGEGIIVFQSPANTGESMVYTFNPEERKTNPEDGLIIQLLAEWVQWIAKPN